MKNPNMVKNLSKKELAELIEQVLRIPHKHVRFTRRNGRRWHVHGERLVFVANPAAPPTPHRIEVNLEGPTLGHPHLKAQLEREAARHGAAKDRHEERFGKKVA